MIWSLCILAAGAFMAAAILRWRGTVFIALARHAVATVDALMSPAEEEVKLPLVEQQTVRLIGSLVLGFFWIILSAVLFWLSSCAAVTFDLHPWTWMDWAVVSIGASLPFFLSAKSQAPYSALQQLFHHLILDAPHVGHWLFKREVKRVLRGNPPSGRPFVIVTGLARAGTTSLLNLLHETGVFASLNYRHMPLLMAPGTWVRWNKPKQSQSIERSHGDGIQLNLESNEALEEYFFSTYDDYVEQEHVSEYSLSVARAEEYAQYQDLVTAQHGGGLYLAKNNNALLRYASLAKHFPSMRTVVLFRQPIFHAASLMEMHVHFSAEQEKDPFFLTYMNWLGHYEFGQNCKAFSFADGSGMPDKSPVTLDDWLERWIAYYERVLAIKDDQMLLLSYDSYCYQPCQAVNVLLKAVGLPSTDIAADAHQNERPEPEGASEEVLRRALALYDRLLIHEMPLGA